MVAVSTVSNWPELKFETSTVPLGAAVMSLGNRPAGMSPTIAGRPSSASATLITVRSEGGYQGWGGSSAGCLMAVAWLLRQPDDAITVQELADRYRSARRTPAGS